MKQITIYDLLPLLLDGYVAMDEAELGAGFIISRKLGIVGGVLLLVLIMLVFILIIALRN